MSYSPPQNNLAHETHQHHDGPYIPSPPSALDVDQPGPARVRPLLRLLPRQADVGVDVLLTIGVQHGDLQEIFIVQEVARLTQPFMWGSVL